MIRKPAFMYRCFCCEMDFQFGPHVYNGRPIQAYGINVCNGCYTSNYDGWAPHMEGRLKAHLQEKGLPIPAMNAGGYFPRDG